MQRQKLRRSCAAVVGAGLLVAACGSAKTSVGSVAHTSPSSAASSSTASGAQPAGSLAQYVSDARTFVGGTSGAADSTEAPITVGYVNQQGGAVDFSDNTLGVDAAVNLINTQLGGIDGHPLKVIDCYVQTEEDGQKCGTQMLNDSAIQFVMTGSLIVGGTSLYNVLDGQKPVLILNPQTAADYSAKQGYAFSGGVAAGYLGIGKFIAEDLQPKPKSVAVITVNEPAGIAAIDDLVVPVLKAAGITNVRIAQVSPTATGPDVVSAVQAANAGSADVTLVSLLSSGCVPTYDALKTLNVTTPVVTTNLCYAKSVAQALNGSFPNKWYYAGLGWNPYMPAVASVPYSWALPLNVKEVEAQPGGASVDPSGAAIYTFGPVLTIAKIMNQVGAANLTAASFGAAMKAYHGPLLGTAGSANCGSNPSFPTVCGNAVGFQQFINGQFVSVADGYNGKAIQAW